MKLKQITTLILSLALLTANALGAGVPRLIPYQGRLTDAADVPVTDGAHLVKFIIYNGATAEARELWNSQFQSITTVDGLFDYNLGSATPISEELFFDTLSYLGITIGTDPEISPRTRFATTPYAFQALFAVRADHAARADIAGEADKVLWSNVGSMPAGFADGTDSVNTNWNSLTNVPSGFADGVDNNSGGDLVSVTAGPGIVVTNGGAPSPTISVANSGITSGMITNGTITSDDIKNSTITGTDIETASVYDIDLADEPGVAHAFSTDIDTPLPAWGSNNANDNDILARSIDAPTAGYVVAIATGYWKHVHTVGTSSWGRLGINTGPDGTTVDFDNLAWTERGSTLPSGIHRESWSITKVTSVSAGTTTFYLRGAARFSNDIYVSRPHLALMFFPTAYGTVTSSTPPVNPVGPQGISSAPEDATEQN